MLRERGKHFQPGETKKAIIEFLLENPSGVDEPILRSYLKEKMGISEPKNIKNLLTNLKETNCATKQEFSGLANKWSIDSITQVERVLNLFHDVLPQLQKNDEILARLVEKQFWLIDWKPFVDEYKKDEEMCKTCLEHSHEPPLCGVPDNVERLEVFPHQFLEHIPQKQRCLERSKQPPPIEDLGKEDFEFFSGNNSKETQNKLVFIFKDQLKKSPHFFKTCLTNTPEQLKQKLNHVFSHGVTQEADPKRRPFEKPRLGEEIGLFLDTHFFKIFEICVFHDILEGENMKKAEISENNVFRGAIA